MRCISDAGRSRGVSELLHGQASETAVLRFCVGQPLQRRKYQAIVDELPRIERVCDAYRKHRLERRNDPKAIMPFGRFAEELGA